MDRADRVRGAPPMAASSLLFELQVEQHRHDETYHREVARLPMHQRLNHMALHFAKYAGKVAADQTDEATVPAYVDILIIALSTANILNIDLWRSLNSDGCEFVGLLAFGRSLANNMQVEVSEHTVFLRETVIATGRMAAACEKIDHLEEVSFREEIKHAIARLSSLALAFISLKGINPEDAVRSRLYCVKKRLILNGRI